MRELLVTDDALVLSVDRAICRVEDGGVLLLPLVLAVRERLVVLIVLLDGASSPWR